MTASAFSLSALYADSQFKVTTREPIIGGLHGATRHFRPFLETYTEEMLPWFTTSAVHRFKRFPPRERFPELLAEFAK